MTEILPTAKLSSLTERFQTLSTLQTQIRRWSRRSEAGQSAGTARGSLSLLRHRFVLHLQAEN